MKKTLLALAAMMSIGISYAQSPVKRYDVTYSSGSSYTPLTGATDLGFTGDWLDTTSNNITLPIPFKYQNVTVNTIAIESYGSIYLNDRINEDMTTGHITGINLGGGYAGLGRGKVFYGVTGSAGSRIFKVEFRNVGRASDAVGNDTLNFQIWLYENNNAIEYRAGYSNVPDGIFANTFNDVMNGSQEPILCGLLNNRGDSIAIASTNLFLHATKYTALGFSDTAITLDDIGVSSGLPDAAAVDAILYGAYPRNGSVIRFVPRTPTSIHKVDFDMATVFPNPSKDGMYQLSLKETAKTGAMVTIYDMTGKAVLQQTLSTTHSRLDLSRFAGGHYFGKINNGDRIGTFKLIKE
ncbi:hypothetical protein DBR32_07315 [Taibaiella sp. KBW10]|uniref:T9SS type A sorting domain-containing protein n=1 Tax=Taibaiella sp. KBW10 TaxID=2153357 RepID=UPI000F59D80C|nr:T9SS type A sorting domain-containing protein [Taibaiella sp. KBW10]RQO31747.1 hypothetical protein DBR32_07315 [Taibaiella sp. KBW10]